jgi:hypothetical protein
MKPTERKTIYREDITLVLFQPPLELEQLLSIAQFTGSFVTQAKSNSKLPGTAELLLNSERPTVERLERLSPIFAWMNVRAVGQVKAMVKFHAR